MLCVGFNVEKICMSAGIFAAIGGVTGVLLLSIFKLKKELEKVVELRLAERQGRIRAEKESAVSSLVDRQTNAWNVFPIGHVRSVYSKRSGTPRQPGLVPAAESRIEIVGELKQSIMGLGEFSHVWVLFLFDKNTNISKRLKAKNPFDGLKLLVEPPKAKGRKVGVLSCRTPHRPNPVGLSLCEILTVEKNAIIVSGLDCLDGTPVIDLKPYLPIVESLPHARAPDWIYQGIDEDREVHVQWGCERKISGCLKDEEKTLRVIEEVLSRDIRSGHQIRMGNELVDNDWEGQVMVAGFTVSYTVSKSKSVTIRSIN